jgi:hypothetical protein
MISLHRATLVADDDARLGDPLDLPFGSLRDDTRFGSGIRSSGPAVVANPAVQGVTEAACSRRRRRARVGDVRLKRPARQIGGRDDEAELGGADDGRPAGQAVDAGDGALSEIAAADGDRQVAAAGAGAGGGQAGDRRAGILGDEHGDDVGDAAAGRGVDDAGLPARSTASSHATSARAGGQAEGASRRLRWTIAPATKP